MMNSRFLGFGTCHHFFCRCLSYYIYKNIIIIYIYIYIIVVRSDVKWCEETLTYIQTVTYRIYG